MSDSTYELIAYIARYWFAILAVLIVARAWRAAVADNRRARLLRAWEGGAGCVGELVLVSDGTRRKRKKEERYLVPAEALLGSGASADIRLHGAGVQKKHLLLKYRPGEMVVSAVSGAPFEARALDDGSRGLRDGDRLRVGELTLMMVFFDAADAQKAGTGKKRRVRQLLPEDVSQDEFEDVWE